MWVKNESKNLIFKDGVVSVNMTEEKKTEFIARAKKIQEANKRKYQEYLKQKKETEPTGT
tara:strand:+ start:11983 stop:12162 length:180 start_codon:yes stop_codon:yes gene_type:complete